MKKWKILPALLVFAGLVLSAELTRAQQSADPTVYQVTFYKTKPGRQADYAKKFEELALPVFRDLLKQGVIEGYFRYQVLMPGGMAAPYDIVSSVQFKDRAAWAAWETKFGAAFQKMFPGRDVGSEFNDLRDPVSTAMFGREMEIGAPPAEGAKPIFVAVSMKVHPGHGEAYRKLFEELGLPVQKELLKQGVIEGYGRYPMVLPTGTSEEVNLVALVRYKDVAAWAAAEGKNAEIGRKLFPNRNLGQESLAHRDVVRTELVRLSHALTKPTS
jgi:heme-degrading monooxygenase HmoA